MPKANPHKTKSGIVWRVQYRVPGKGGKQSVVTDTFDTQKAGDDFAELVDRVGGEAARDTLRRRRASNSTVPTFAEWTTTYLDPASGILTGIQPGTRHGYERMTGAFLPMLGEYPIDSITRDDIGRWLQWYESQPSGRTAGKLVSAKTVRNHQALLSNIFKAAVDREKIPRNPAKGIRATEGESREGVFLTPHEFDQIITHIPAHYKPLVAFLVDTGCRWGEATALTWADVNLSVQPPTARISKAWKKGVDGKPVLGPPKSKKSRRTVPLGELSFDYLPRQGQPADLVFPGREGGRMWYGMFNTRIWKPAVAKANIGKTPNIHDLRHTAASWLIIGGVPITDVQAQLGHEKIDTTASVYSHLSPDSHAKRAYVMNAATQQIRRPIVELEA